MGEEIRGMVVYHRTTFKRGKITASNQFTGQIAVAWDDGSRELLNVSELMSEKLYEEIQETERTNQMALKLDQAVMGATVYLTAKEPPLRKGKIMAPPTLSSGTNLVIVETEDDGALKKYQLKQLLSESDGLAENKRLQDEKERLEKEFEEVEKLCSANLRDAAKLINDAAKMAAKQGVSVQDMDGVYDLERAMDNAGWNTSSWSC
jgi:molecular chaperone DnaK (HSP70)